MKVGGNIVILVAIFIACAAIASSEAVAECTTFIGMSQTRQTCDGLERIGAQNFVCWLKGSEEIEGFADGSAFRGLTERQNHCNGAHPKDSTRIAIQLSAPTQTRAEVRSLTEQVVDQVRDRFSNVQKIILITATGGPDGNVCPVRDDMSDLKYCVMIQGTCYVRDSVQYNSQSWQGMIDYTSTDNAVSVYASEVCVCDDYSDGKGHFVASGKRCTAHKWQESILSTTAPPPPDSEPDSGSSGDCPVNPSPGQTLYNACYSMFGYSKPFSVQERRDIRGCRIACENADASPAPDTDADSGGPEGCPVNPSPGQTVYNACSKMFGYSKPFSVQERRDIRACRLACE